LERLRHEGLQWIDDIKKLRKMWDIVWDELLTATYRPANTCQNGNMYTDTLSVYFTEKILVLAGRLCPAREFGEPFASKKNPLFILTGTIIF